MMNRKIILSIFVLLLSFDFINSQMIAGKQSSLWRDQSFVNNLYSDPKARDINDIVIIKVTENSTATNKAKLTTSKKTQTSLGIDSFLGLETDLKGKVTSNFDPKAMFGGTTNNSNAGSGESSRETQLSTYIAARVVDLLPNRNLVIEAKKEIMVNKEKQIVVLKGVVRPRDLSYDNIVESTKIADLQIKFTGKGPISEQAKRGWLSWILNLIWPF
jgi:flagellar L-ring protein precursor FlgH